MVRQYQIRLIIINIKRPRALPLDIGIQADLISTGLTHLNRTFLMGLVVLQGQRPCKTTSCISPEIARSFQADAYKANLELLDRAVSDFAIQREHLVLSCCQFQLR
jgi:hypothetical protein